MRKSKLLIIIFAVFMFLGFKYTNNVFALECNYGPTATTPAYKLALELDNGKIKMTSCKESTTRGNRGNTGNAYKDCSSYKLNDTYNNHVFASNYCPHSINVKAQLITLVDGKYGKYKLIENNSTDTKIYSCKGLSEYDCEHNSSFACIWNKTESGGYCNVDNLTYVKCGSAYDIPSQVPKIVSFVVNLLKIATPIILILVSIITLLKALAASKEDEIKKAQSSLIKKLIAAALVFFIITIVQFVISKVADDNEQGDLKSCFACLLNNDCSGSVYYKTNVGGTHDGVNNSNGTYICTYLNGKEETCK